MEVEGSSWKVKVFKEKLKTVECNIRDSDNSVFGFLFMLCFGVGVVLLFMEWFFWIPRYNLWVVCFGLGMFFLFFVIIGHYNFR